MMRSKFKMIALGRHSLAPAVFVAVVLLRVTATPALSADSSDGSKTEAEALKIMQESRAAYAALSSYSDTGTSETEMGRGRTVRTVFNIQLARTNLYRIEWEQSLTLNTATTRATTSSRGAAWSAGDGDYYLGDHGPEKKKGIAITMAAASGVSAAMVPSTFFDLNYGMSLKQSVTEGHDLVRLKDESVGSVNCYVISGKASRKDMTATETRWIGKDDHLIHKAVTEIQHSKLPPKHEGVENPIQEAMHAEERELVRKPTIITEMHDNIVLNKTFIIKDFIHEEPDAK